VAITGENELRDVFFFRYWPSMLSPYLSVTEGWTRKEQQPVVRQSYLSFC